MCHGFCASLVYAQDGARGGLRGTVKDADFYIGVPDAAITLEPGGQSVRADKEGRFFINELPPGVYNLAVQAEGFVRATRNGVVVQAGSVREVDLELTAQVVELDEFIVQDVETGATEIVPLSLGADLSAFASAISPELMKASGSSGDIGSALKRLASTAVVDSRYVVVRGLSDRYNVVVLNGARLPSSDPDKRAVNIDIFPTGLVETIISSKTATPTLPGEATGGYLNIITKRVPAEPFVTISMSSGYNTMSTGTGQFLSYRGGGTDFLGNGDSRTLPSVMRPTSALPSDPGTTSYFTNLPTAADRANFQFSQNREAAARALQGRAMGTQYKDAPMDFSFSMIAGTRVDDFMGGTLGIVGGVTYGKKFIMEQGVRGFASMAAGDPVPTERWDYTKGTESLLAGALLSASLEFSPKDRVTLTYFTNLSAQDDAIFSYGETQGLGTVSNGVPLDEEETIVFREFMFYTERSLQTLQLTGEHSIQGMEDIKIDWLATYSKSYQYQPDLRKANYAYDYNLESYVGTGDPAPPDQERVWRRLDDSNYNIALNAEIPLDEGARNGGNGTKLRFGGAFEQSTRDYTNDNFEYFGTPNRGLIASYLGVAPGGGLLRRPPSPDDRQTLTLGDILGDLDLLDQGRDDLGGGVQQVFDNFFLARAFNVPAREVYASSQTIPAFYASFTFALKENFEATVGARLEYTKMDVEVQLEGEGAVGNFLNQFNPRRMGNLTFVNFGIDRTDLLPSISTRWQIADEMSLRSAVSRTVARPTFKEIAVVFSRDPETGNFFVGNPALEMSSITNFDVRWEWTPAPGDQFAVSLFAKQIDKPIEFINLGVFNTARNERSAFLYGFEIEAYKELGNLIEDLRGFTLGINYGFVLSKVDLTEDSEGFRRRAGLSLDRPLQGQPDYTFNTNLSYEFKDLGFTATVLLNITGPLLYTVGGQFENNLTPDIYQRPFTSLDLAFNQKLNDTWSVNLRVTNLLNQPRERYFLGGLPFSVTETGTTYTLGLSGKW
jgi:outer membrane receptor protein involved in Fe transport